MAFPTVEIQLPHWIDTVLSDPGRTYPTDNARQAANG
jgi:hypothetical protein